MEKASRTTVAKTYWSDHPSLPWDIEEDSRPTLCQELGLSNNQPTPGHRHVQGQQGFLYQGFNYQLVPYFHKILEVAWWSSVHRCMESRPGSNTKPAGFLQTPEVSAPGEMFGVDFMGPFPFARSPELGSGSSSLLGRMQNPQSPPSSHQPGIRPRSPVYQSDSEDNGRLM